MGNLKGLILVLVVAISASAFAEQPKVTRKEIPASQLIDQLMAVFHTEGVIKGASEGKDCRMSLRKVAGVVPQYLVQILDSNGYNGIVTISAQDRVTLTSRSTSAAQDNTYDTVSPSGVRQGVLIMTYEDISNFDLLIRTPSGKLMHCGFEE